MTQDQKTPKPPVATAPTASARRFLAQLMEYQFREGWRTPDDFVKHFPAETIMAALERAPDLRVAILAAATGIHEQILRRKSPALAAEDLSLALDEGTTSSMQLLSVFSPEDRVRFLDARRLWDFLAEDQFWRFDPEGSDEQRQGAADRMSFTLTQALTERLLSLRDILDGLTYEAVADSLSPHELRTVVRHALIKGRDGIGLNEKVLLEVLPLDKLVRSLPLEHIWNEVVVRRIAIQAGFTDLSQEERRVSHSERPASQRASERPPSEPRRSRASERPPSEPRRSRASERPPSERWSSRPSSGPPPLPPELVRPAAPLPALPLPALSMPSMALSSASLAEPLTAEIRSVSDLRPTREPRSAPQFASPVQLAPAYYPGSPVSEANGYMPSLAGTNDYREEDEELTTAAPSVSMRDGSLLPPPLRSTPPSSPGSSPYQLTDDFNHPLQAPMASVPQAPPPPPSSRQRSGGFDGQDSEQLDRQRQRVTEHLRAIGRLPPRHATMPAGVLRSIDAMYALLPSATDDIQRKSVIRQAFGNENHLRVALLGLIELMDSSVDTSDPVIQEAKIDALIKILLFEEQRRKENGRFPAGGFGTRPSSMPPSMQAQNLPPPSSTPGAYYFPQQSNAGYAGGHVSTQRPPPPVLNGTPYPGTLQPLPNLPGDSRPSQLSSREVRRTMPPPLPPSYPRG
jgi:hypothetical protein